MNYRLLVLIPVGSLVAGTPLTEQTNPAEPVNVPLPSLIVPVDPNSANNPSDPHSQAKFAVQQEVVAKLMPRRHRFSRAAPRFPSPSFQPPLLVEGEKRLPFKVVDRFSQESSLAAGYVRLSDNAIFIVDPSSGKHRPIHEDPRFAEPTAPKSKSKT